MSTVRRLVLTAEPAPHGADDLVPATLFLHRPFRLGHRHLVAALLGAGGPKGLVHRLDAQHLRVVQADVFRRNHPLLRHGGRGEQQAGQGEGGAEAVHVA